jgi:ABC-type Fe3+-hydroxamate transport system substrate-binding protein
MSRSTLTSPLTSWRSRRGVLTVALIAPALALAGCGSSSAGSTSTSDGATSVGASASAASSASAGASGAAGQDEAAATFPVTVKAGNGSVPVTARPTAIVSLSPSATETLYAIGAGAQVKAVDDQSSYPVQAPRTKLSGFQPNAEAVAGYQPDLVVVSSDANGLVAALTKLKLPVLVMPAPANLDESYTQELALGAATGHPAQAQRVVDGVKTRIAAAVAAVPKSAQPEKVYHEVDQTYYSVTSSTFIGSLYAKFSLKNIADGAAKAVGGYPQLSAEFVITSAPDLIVLADSRCCQQSPQSVAKRPAFASIPAVKNGKVITVDDDIASRWGPRVADLAEQVARALGATI